MLCGLVPLVLVAAASPARAERLTLKAYTTADGLPNNTVERVVADSRGFLWFCTGDGLSRFDGYTFTNYSLDQGLPSAIVTDLLETRAGAYWIATEAGLVRFDPLGTPLTRATSPQAATGRQPSTQVPSGAMFTTYLPRTEGRARYITSLLEDRAGGLWVGTMEGLYRATAGAGGRLDFTLVDLGARGVAQAPHIPCLIEDRRGALWIGSTIGLYRRSAEGRIERVALSSTALGDWTQSLLEDRDGTIWAGTRSSGLFQVVVDPVSDRPAVVHAYTQANGLLGNWINDVVQTKDSTLWVGSSGGLIQLVPTAGGQGPADGGRGDREPRDRGPRDGGPGERPWQARAYAASQGVRGEVRSLAEDHDRNLWLGTGHEGVAKLRYRRITTFDAADGLVWAGALLETREGDVVAVGGATAGLWALYRFDETAIALVGRPLGIQHPGWGWHQTVVQDRQGHWWIAAGTGLLRYAPPRRIEDLARASPAAIYTTRDGLSSDSVLCVFEDSRGDVWVATVGTVGGLPHGLSRWQRSTGTFHHYTDSAGLPPRDRAYVSSIAEDRAGHIWVGFSGVDGLARFDGHRFTRFTPSDGVPAGLIINLLSDVAGRLWATTDRAGLCRIDRPDAARPTFVTYTTATGLSSNVTGAVVDDRAGLIYIGTGRGIDRLDPATDRFTHYASADGVPTNAVAALRDRHGALWFSTPTGLVRFVPAADLPTIAPPILITGVRLGARRLPISAVGERDVAPIELPSGNNQLQVDFVALGSTSGDRLRYQYQLEGTAREWSQPSDQRTVNFASLASGSYRFLVRAVNADGVVSPAPATVAFTVLPPVWQRWWFIALVALALAAVIYTLHRTRVVRLLDVANMRTRIATDLHDDIGANLTRIAILSEVARQQAAADGNGHGRLDAPLAGIARIARESVAGMSDIVWAINPDRDSLADLVRKMREHVEEVFAVRNLAVVFHALDQAQTPKPGAARLGAAGLGAGKPGAARLGAAKLAAAKLGAAKLGATVRRDVYLIFKEAVNNAARHAHCSTVTVDFHVDRARLRLAVTDDGVGFDPSADSDGLGLTSMRRRAARLGASLDFESRAGVGTTVTLTMAIERGAIPRAVTRRARPYLDG